ncbi:MAG TPA: hypothetical protein VHE30_14370 [Polyangiaceae bacterium]|nr:hypothetical protein [Polyangiaceae bacterium]
MDSCDTCRAEGLACVRYEAFVQSVHCVRKPPGCDVPTCACMDACGGISCGEASDGTIGCFCPSC